MTQPYAADDYAAIAQAMKHLRDQPKQTQKWGIWYTEEAGFVVVFGRFNWGFSGHNANLTLFDSKEEAQAVIDQEQESFRSLCEPREYPGADQ